MEQIEKDIAQLTATLQERRKLWKSELEKLDQEIAEEQAKLDLLNKELLSHPSSSQKTAPDTKAQQEKEVIVIPGSMRKDGTFRKDVKIKPGYIPPDYV